MSDLDDPELANGVDFWLKIFDKRMTDMNLLHDGYICLRLLKSKFS